MNFSFVIFTQDQFIGTKEVSDSDSIDNFMNSYLEGLELWILHPFPSNHQSHFYFSLVEHGWRSGESSRLPQVWPFKLCDHRRTLSRTQLSHLGRTTPKNTLKLYEKAQNRLLPGQFFLGCHLQRLPKIFFGEALRDIRKIAEKHTRNFDASK